MLLLASSAASLSSPLGGFLCGVIIPLPTYPLSAIHPEGSIPSSSPEAFRAAASCMDPGGPHESSGEQDRDPNAHARSPALTAMRIAAVASAPAEEEGAVHHESRSPRAPPRP